MGHKQAIIITVYKNWEYLEKLVRMLYLEFDIYIHVDKKSKEIQNNEITILETKYKCNVIKKYEICWGGINHLYAVIDLLKLAIKRSYLYYHIISGEDIPVCSKKDMLARFSNDDMIYITLNETTTMWNERYKYYYFLKNKDLRIRKYKWTNNLLLLIQKVCKICRNHIGQERHIYKGYLYSSLPYYAVEYVLEYIAQNNDFLKDLSYCLIPEEFFFQTILGNSQYRDKIAKKCLRYSVWEYKHGSIPGYLDENDIKQIDEGDFVFARKVNFKYSDKLIEILDERWYQK